MRVSARDMMKDARYAPFAPTSHPHAPVVEPAPGRSRINRLAIVMMAVFGLLAARAVQLSLAGAPASARVAAPVAMPVLARADLVDRNGVLMATMLPSWTLAGEPEKVWDAAQAARRLATVVPGLDAAATERRLRSKSKFVHLKPGLTTSQRRAVHDLGIAGISFEREQRRVYPNGVLAGHALGSVNRDGAGAGGVEAALDADIRRAAEAGTQVALSIDTRIQYALETELADAAWGAKAKGGAGVILDGRTGEVLAIASWPQVDPNAPGAGTDVARLNRATGAVFEMGSTLKPFTAAMALDLDQLRLAERFDLTASLNVDGVTIRDPHPFAGPATIREAMSHSSNVAMAQVALRVGAARQRDYLGRLGLLEKPSIEIGGMPAPLLPRGDSRLTTAVLGYGHGLAPTLVALAGAYTVFTNGGARTNPTMLRHADGDPVRRTRVFSALSTQETLQLMRDVVVEGTARRADLGGLDIAGKTGTAEKPGADGKYDPDVLFSSFAAVFPARAPRYVIVLALDEPQRTAENGNLATGGAVAAPAVGRVVARIAPFLAHAPARPEGPRTGGGTP
ncbi:MAG: penicillin-binding protein 2 [Hyphomonadaceae bacterium]|nr:penicillin-binding protein 2 [Hyphomonadaceae bacterium]